MLSFEALTPHMLQNIFNGVCQLITLGPARTDFQISKFSSNTLKIIKFLIIMQAIGSTDYP
jgi:hypothetical protein